eukprot:6664500-Karenia_brevis.AAC.1
MLGDLDEADADVDDLDSVTSSSLALLMPAALSLVPLLSCECCFLDWFSSPPSADLLLPGFFCNLPLLGVNVASNVFCFLL